MQPLTDTIVAPITGTHPAPVAVVRLSGPDAWEIASRVFAPWPCDPEPRRALYGKVCEAEEGLALPFEEGKSYTGERSVEISVHGSPASVRRLVDACLSASARMAEPGEFTLRAFLNGRIDLTQAEGVRDTVNAVTEAQLRQAALHREGKLHEEVTAIRGDIAKVLAAVEASVDFSEEVGELDREAAGHRLEEARTRLSQLISTTQASRLLRQGIRVVIAGLPNAGKSSLFNAVLGVGRAIVTDVPGTTRDYVEEQVEQNGLLWVLVDTAGLRNTSDKVERLGVDLARQLASHADAVWYVFDASKGWTPEDELWCGSMSAPFVCVANKSDLEQNPKTGIPVSATIGAGVDRLFEETAKILHLEGLHERVLLNARHSPLVERAISSIEAALDALSQPVPDDLVAVGLYDALNSLGQVTGETATEDMLERIFADFCIGK